MELRQRRNWTEGTPLIALDTDRGVLIASREDLERIVREQLAGSGIAAELLEERRATAAREDEA